MNWIGAMTSDAKDKCTCPKCGATPGNPCVTPRGRETSVHGLRCSEVKKLADSMGVDPWVIQASPIEEDIAFAMALHSDVTITPSGHVSVKTEYPRTGRVTDLNNLILAKDPITFDEFKAYLDQMTEGPWLLNPKGSGYIFVPNKAGDLTLEFTESVLNFSEQDVAGLFLLRNLAPYFFEQMQERIKELENQLQCHLTSIQQ